MRFYPFLLFGGILIAGLGIALQLAFAIGSVLTIMDLLMYLVTLVGLGIAFKGYIMHRDELEKVKS